MPCTLSSIDSKQKIWTMSSTVIMAVCSLFNRTLLSTDLIPMHLLHCRQTVMIGCNHTFLEWIRAVHHINGIIRQVQGLYKNKTSILSIYLVFAGNGIPVQVRLVNSTTSSGSIANGYVQAFYNGQWGYICTKISDVTPPPDGGTPGWGMDEANVVCRQLG